MHLYLTLNEIMSSLGWPIKKTIYGTNRVNGIKFTIVYMQRTSANHCQNQNQKIHLGLIPQ